eukprot:1625139-Pleurochrysis_carterae.AAC.1
MLVIAWCAHVGSSFASLSPRTRRAALRAAAARSFIARSRDEVEDVRLHGLGDADIAEERC